MKGIELFTQLTALDVSGCTALTALDASGLTLSTLNITGVPGFISTRQYTLSDTKKLLYGGNPTITSDAKFYAKQLELTEGSLRMYFYMEPASTTSGLSDNSIMEFYVGNSSTKQTAKYDASVTYTDYYDSTNHTFSATQSSGTAVTHYGFACDVTSIQMADSIQATFTPGDSGSPSSITYTVADYLDAVIALNGSATDLAKAIKDYGHYVQKPLATLHGFVTVATAINEGKEGHITIPTSNTTITNVTTTTVESYKLTSTLGDGAEVGSALQLDSNITLLVYLPSGTTVNEVKKGDETNALTLNTDYSVDGEDYKTGGKVVVAIPNLTAKELTTKYTITTSDSNKTVTAYGLSYVHSVLNLTDAQKTALKASSTNLLSLNDNDFNDFVTNLQNAVKALYNYYYAETQYNPQNS